MPDFLGVLTDGTVGGELGSGCHVHQTLAAEFHAVSVLAVCLQLGTRGALSPNITNPDNTLYYDNYDITEHLKVGGNAIAFVLGNGMQNTDFKQWDFHKASFRSAPKLALALELDDALFMEADESFKCANSPITYDDLRSGEYYDARQEKVGFSLYGYDDSKWTQALLATTPKGRPTYNDIPPIIELCRL